MPNDPQHLTSLCCLLMTEPISGGASLQPILTPAQFRARGREHPQTPKGGPHRQKKCWQPALCKQQPWHQPWKRRQAPSLARTTRTNSQQHPQRQQINTGHILYEPCLPNRIPFLSNHAKCSSVITYITNECIDICVIPDSICASICRSSMNRPFRCWREWSSLASLNSLVLFLPEWEIFRAYIIYVIMHFDFQLFQLERELVVSTPHPSKSSC